MKVVQPIIYHTYENAPIEVIPHKGKPLINAYSLCKAIETKHTEGYKIMDFLVKNGKAKTFNTFHDKKLRTDTEFISLKQMDKVLEQFVNDTRFAKSLKLFGKYVKVSSEGMQALSYDCVTFEIKHTQFYNRINSEQLKDTIGIAVMKGELYFCLIDVLSIFNISSWDYVVSQIGIEKIAYINEFQYHYKPYISRRQLSELVPLLREISRDDKYREGFIKFLDRAIVPYLAEYGFTFKSLQ